MKSNLSSKAYYVDVSQLPSVRFPGCWQLNTGLAYMSADRPVSLKVLPEAASNSIILNS